MVKENVLRITFNFCVALREYNEIKERVYKRFQSYANKKKRKHIIKHFIEQCKRIYKI